MTPLFRTQNLVFADLIHYPDIEVPSEGVTFLTGESGSGKTSLLRMFNATVSPSDGQLFYRGTDISELDSIALRREVLLVAQQVFLFPGSISHAFAEFYRYRELQAPDEDTMHTFLSLCRADFDLGADVDRLSGGERQRVFCAINLSLLPSVLLLDEPTSALDDDTAAELLTGVIAHCSRQAVPIVAITHNKAFAREFADTEIHLPDRSNV